MSTSTPKNQMTRRQFLARTGALGALGLSLPAFLAACGGIVKVAILRYN